MVTLKVTINGYTIEKLLASFPLVSVGSIITLVKLDDDDPSIIYGEKLIVSSIEHKMLLDDNKVAEHRRVVSLAQYGKTRASFKESFINQLEES